MPRFSPGEALSKYFVKLRHVAAHLKIYTRDPNALLRHHWDGWYDTPWEYTPNIPSLSPYPNNNIWQFVSPADVDTMLFPVFSPASVGSGSALAVQDAAGGQAKFTTGATSGNYYYYFANRETGRFRTDKGLWFSTCIEISNVNIADMFVGLCARLASGNLFDNRVDAVGFYMTSGDPTLKIEARKNGTATQAEATECGDASNNMKLILHFQAFGTSGVNFFIENQGSQSQIYTMESVGRILNNLPDDEELAFCFGLRTGGNEAVSFAIETTNLIQDR